MVSFPDGAGPKPEPSLLEEAKQNLPDLYTQAMADSGSWRPLAVLKSGKRRDVVGIPDYDRKDYEKVAGALIEKFKATEIVVVLEAQCTFGEVDSVGLVMIHGNETETAMVVTKVDVDGQSYATRNWSNGEENNIPFTLHKVFDKDYRKDLCKGFKLKKLVQAGDESHGLW
jgi:hypothetical protein